MGATEIFQLVGTLALNGTDQVNDELKGVSSNGEKAEGRLSSAFKKIGAAVATYFAVDKIVDFGKAAVDAAATVSAEASAFEQIMGDYSGTAQEKMKAVADATGVVDTRLTGYMTSMTAKFKGLGYGIDDATTLASDGLTLASDAAAFWDKSLDDSMGALNSFINGSYEGGEAIGLFANDTQMAQYAIKQGLVDSTAAWSSLDEATKQATRLEYAEAMYEQSGATGQAAKEAEQYANVQANLTEKWRQFKAQIGEPILQNVVLPAMQKLSEVVDASSEAFEKATTWVKKHQTEMQVLTSIIIGVTTAVSLFLIVLNWGSIAGAASAALNAVKTAVLGVNAAINANPIAFFVTLIAGLVAAFIYLWNNCEGFRKFWIDLWNNIKVVFNDVVNWMETTLSNMQQYFSDKWNAIKNAIISPIEEAKNTVKSLIDKIRGFFNFSWSLPKLKLPHVSIKGEFSLMPPKVPTFGIDWYAKAMRTPMIMDQPTAFGINPSGQLMVGGERGSEVVSGTETLINMIRASVAESNEGMADTLERIIAILAQYLPMLTQTQMVLDTGTLVGEIAPQIDNELGKIKKWKGAV